MVSLFITGSDTSVGKTIITTILASYLTDRMPGRVGIFKPVQSGRGDREFYYQHLVSHQTLDEICPQYFSTPLALPLAAAREGKNVDLSLLWQSYQKLREKNAVLLIEGSGGIGSPITWEYTGADLARDWGLPTILVVPVRLGSMSQAISSCALARERGVDLRGIIFNCVQPYTEEEIYDFVAPDRLAFLTQVPILGVVPCLESFNDREELKLIAAGLDLTPLGFD